MTKTETALVTLIVALLGYVILSLVGIAVNLQHTVAQHQSSSLHLSAGGGSASGGQPSAFSLQPSSITVVARTLYDECRGEPIEGRKLVASTLWADAGGDPARLQEAALKLFRYSCWNNKPRDLATLNSSPCPLNLFDAKAWDECIALATMMHNGTFMPVGLSDDTLVTSPTNYHRNDGHRRPWPGVQKVVGNHRFYFNRKA